MTETATAKGDDLLLRLSSPTEIVEALPYLFGFHPAHSLVVLSLRGARRRLGLHARIDLGDPRHDPELADYITGYLMTDKPDEALVVVYADSAPAGAADLPRRPLVDAVRVQLGQHGVKLRDALYVAGGRWWSYQCSNPACCPPEGTPVPAASAGSHVAATATYVGMAALPDREALVRSLDPVTGAAGAAMGQALARAEAAWLARLHPVRSRKPAAEDLELVRAETGALLDDLLRRRRAGEAAMSDDEAASIIVAIVDVLTRDDAAMRVEREDLTLAVGLWTDIVRRALPPWTAPAAAVLGWISYMSGNGALACIAAEHALAVDPDYSLARLILELANRAVPPQVVREVSNPSYAAKREQPRARAGGKRRRRGS